jgi:hypothetical protein
LCGEIERGTLRAEIKDFHITPRHSAYPPVDPFPRGYHSSFQESAHG